MMCNNFKKERYTIPTFNFGGSTRSSTGTLPSTGSPIYVVAGATGVYINVIGTRYGSSSLAQETFYTTISSSAGGIASAYTDWTSVLGMSLTDNYGMNMTTQLVETSVYSVSTGSTTQIAYTSSGCKGTKTVAFAINGQELSHMTVSGNAYIATKIPYATTAPTLPIAPSSNNSFKYTDGMVGEERVRDWIMFGSDTGGAVAQVRVWEG